MPKTSGVHPHEENGFTVMELLVVLTIMGVLLSIGGIYMTDYLRKSRLREAARELEGGLELIRTTARSHQRPVAAFVDTNTLVAAHYADSSNNGFYDEGEPLEENFLYQSFSAKVQLSVAGGAGFAAPASTIQFTEIGTLRDAQRIITVQTNDEPNRRYMITIYTTGRTEVKRSEDGGVTSTLGY